MSASLVRSSLRKTVRLQRWSSSTASTSATPSIPRAPAPTNPEISLPPEKMRALVDLYHSTSTFITEETLDAHIDVAFLVAPKLQHGSFERDMSRQELVARLNQRQAQPKLGSTDKLVHGGEGSAWSIQMSAREGKLVEALFGATKGRPGLEAVEEEAERIKQEKREQGKGEQEQRMRGR